MRGPAGFCGDLQVPGVGAKKEQTWEGDGASLDAWVLGGNVPNVPRTNGQVNPKLRGASAGGPGWGVSRTWG